MKRLVIASGYFNPIHIGHIEYLNLAKKKGDQLIVIINNDNQRKLKGSKFFMNEIERESIVANIKSVDKTIISIDIDRSVNKTLELIYEKYKNNFQLFFANGGDQFFEDSPERIVCSKLGIQLIDGLGEKIQSSSLIIERCNAKGN